VNPSRDRVSLYFRLHPNENVRTPLLIEFLRQLLRHLPLPLIILWDHLSSHRSRDLRRWLESHPRIQLEFLPPYAPELNPVEYLWSYLKTNPLANVAATDLDPLAQLARLHGRRLQHSRDLLRSFIDHSPLSLRLE
jgi:transposase